MKNIKIKTLTLFISLCIYAIVYFTVSDTKHKLINESLNNELQTLELQYKLIQYYDKQAGDLTVKYIHNSPEILNILKDAINSNTEQREILRKKLKKILAKLYSRMDKRGVFQFHFVLPNNISFLRMHQVDRYGDYLGDVRYSHKYVNDKKKQISGFEKGRVLHGYRNVYPIGYKDQHLGSVEISFLATSIQKSLTQNSKIHTHFLIHKDLFQSHKWNIDSKYNFIQSAEHIDFLFSITNKNDHYSHKGVENKTIENLKTTIKTRMDNKEKFALCTNSHGEHIEVISFLPIKNIKNQEVVAYLVSYSESKNIGQIMKYADLFLLIIFILISIISYFVYKQIISKQKLQMEHRLLNDVLNSTDDIMFVTNFKTISFSNRKFRNFMSVQDEVEFNSSVRDNLLTIFSSVEGYLHKDMLRANETFDNLILRNKKVDRVVCILDKTITPKAFKIDVSKTYYSSDTEYLVTLTDITKLKEKECDIQHKAYYDGLTKVYNRNKFDEILKMELKRVGRYKNNLSIAILDIDHFKNFNDTYGHLIGDEVLIMLAKHINNIIRDTDTFARWGGEEFVILFPYTNANEAKIICEKLKDRVSKLKHEEAGNITVSFGVTQYKQNDTLETIFKRCDDALYDSKANGRNQVSLR